MPRHLVLVIDLGAADAEVGHGAGGSGVTVTASPPSIATKNAPPLLPGEMK